MPSVVAETFSGDAQRGVPPDPPSPACWEGVHLGLQGPLPRHKWLSPSLPAQDPEGRYPPDTTSLGNQGPEATHWASGL